MSVAIAPAITDDDVNAVRTLCRAFVAWLHERYPDQRAAIDTVYGPEKLTSLLAALPVLHAPPDGVILLARRGGAPTGCAMLGRQSGDACEVKRLFVDPAARGAGVAQALMAALMQAARDAGYARIRLDTGNRHDEALALYERLGFRRVAPFADPGAALRDFMIYMERDL